MLSKLINLNKKKSISKNELLQLEWKRFSLNQQHEWIFIDKVLLRHFKDFYSRLPLWSLQKMSNDKPICFLRANGQFACTLSSIEKTHTVIMFPQLIRILHSASPERGLAILSHELGHVIHDHYKKDIRPIEAQIEADKLAFTMNLGEELQDFLLEQNQISEIRVRVNKLSYLLLNS
jgi:hypothetical protein